jgi:hypothetical protein
MAASRNTRHHEAAHAVAAHILEIGLGKEGMVLRSDQDAYVAIADVSADETSESWFIRRVAVKLAGPLAMCRMRGQRFEWDTLRSSSEYCQDFEDSLSIFRDYWRRIGRNGSNDQIDEQMNRAASVAIDCIQKNEATIIAVANDAEGKDRLSRNEIIALVSGMKHGSVFNKFRRWMIRLGRMARSRLA